jgi:hypothetical protein
MLQRDVAAESWSAGELDESCERRMPKVLAYNWRDNKVLTEVGAKMKRKTESATLFICESINLPLLRLIMYLSR